MASSPSDSRPPLLNVRVVELAGLAPAPFAGLLLASYGASVLRVDRPHPHAHTSESPPPTADLLTAHKASIALDLKAPGGLSLLRAILKDADVLIEPFRPGVLEALGLSPTELLALNKRLVIARLTGFRRDGRYAKMAGHDINYLAVSGVLSQLGRKGEAPYAPANILADFAGGGLMCAFGILMALFAREQTGKGQVVESAMVDGAGFLGTMMRLGTKLPLWDHPRGENLLDGGAPFYDVYECKCGGFMAVGALEEIFFRELVKGLALDPKWSRQRQDRTKWPELRNTLRSTFLQKTRTEWESIFDGKDACCTPLLGQRELEDAGYEQRAPVGLCGTPALKIDQHEAWNSVGLAPGIGGEQILQKWLGWQRGRDYRVSKGGLIKINVSKL